jgi:PHP family Zn ribbon phosphoesterase
MQFIADLQIHSKYARAVSPEMTLPNIHAWAKRKGISLMATGDWTHPMWFREIERDLEECGNGLLQLRAEIARKNLDASPVSLGEVSQITSKPLSSSQSGAALNFPDSPHATESPYFLLASEVSSIYTQNGKGRRVHTLIWVPSLDAARKVGQEMTKRGCNLMSDGRPIIPLTSIQVAELVFSIEPKALVIPAHAWTPWFSVFGSMSGFDSIAEAFGEYADRIYAVETGLSSNPSMNWQIKELDNRRIVSFSDAHSGPKIGREATVFEIPDGKLSYDAIYQAIKGDADAVSPKHSNKPTIAYTIEFYPEEGKYHYTGHRACNVRLNPSETKAKGTTCPVCGKPLTQGVMQRVEELAGRSEADLKLKVEKVKLTQNGPEVAMTKSAAFPDRPGFVMLVPLQETIAEAIGSPVSSGKTQLIYNTLTDKLGGEFNVLLHNAKDEIAKYSNERVALGVEKVRTGDIVIDPGYDGVFGVVKIWKDGDTAGLVDKTKEQLSMF